MIEHADLNLFRVFEAILVHRNVAAASRELGVTASAVSHSLARLRRLLDDELFVPTADGMAPTRRAMELAPDIRDGLRKLVRSLDARSLDPSEMARTFAIAASDLTTVVVLPWLMRRMLASAPRVGLRIAPIGRLDVVQQLDDGRLDLVIGWFDALPHRMRRQRLMDEQEAMVVRAGHPLTRQEMTRDRLLGYPHVVVELTGSEALGAEGGFRDERGVIRRIWLERLLLETGVEGGQLPGRVAVTIPNYAAVTPLLEATDMVATLPLRLARRVVERDGLILLDLPYQPLSVQIEMVWHERAEADAALLWLAGQVAAAAAEATTDEPACCSDADESRSPLS